MTRKPLKIKNRNIAQVFMGVLRVHSQKAHKLNVRFVRCEIAVHSAAVSNVTLVVLN